MDKNTRIDSLFLNNKRFKKTSFSDENEFETEIISNINRFFEKKIILEFKFSLKTEDKFEKNVAADLIIIDEDYTSWTIIEVEYYHKKKSDWLRKHVVPQMDKITHINYSGSKSNEIYDWVSKKLDSENVSYKKHSLKSLMLLNQPNFLVILNDYPPDIKNWSTALINCEIVVLRFYKDAFENYIYFKDYVKEIPDECLVVKNDDYNDYMLVQKPSAVYDLSKKNITLLVNSPRNNIVDREINFKVHNDQKNILLCKERGLKKGKYILTKGGDKTILTDKK